ncbi:dynamin family protein [Pseudonocardia sp. WMMC193]|uniref:dynamin family protein n=1 Tax=Pseudonocardia sp. WMMC193 TaxID=2911965 RepID=UPI001F18BF2E|nr:dynamin family protein [Pseudonocardia sp. WMMC193]MCF7552030.1 dynamin family protein [Pseudonocardia sp. WMMC193]
MASPATTELVDLALTATAAYGRPDLGARLEAAKARLADPGVRVLVVGEFKQGKSKLVNALVNASVCPVDDDIATAVPTEVRFGEAPSAVLVGEHERTPIAVEQLGEHVVEGLENPLRAEVTLPRKLLAGGLVLVDTPGVGGLGSAHGAATMAALPLADAVLLVSDAAQEYTAPELDFLRAAMELCPTVGAVVTKTDLYPHWRRIADLDREHLRRAGVEAELFPVSSDLRLAGAAQNDAELLAESGFAPLVGFLLRKVVARAEDLDRRSTSQDVRAVAEQLAAGFTAELAALRDPAGAEALVAELTSAKERADELRQRSARWQITLNDGVADLISDIEYDLRDRLRAVTREAEQLLDDAADPNTIWDQFAEWLHQQVSQATSANYVWTAQRARWLAEQVAEHFSEAADAAVPDITIDGSRLAGSVDPLEKPEGERFGVGQRLFIGMRGGYGGVLMIGLATTFVGMALLNPVSLAAGLLFGGKTVRDEYRRVRDRRRAEAKTAVRRHIDEVVFQVGKDSRDTLRRAQRQLRDHFTVLAEELSRSLATSVAAAQSAVATESSQRTKRIADLEAELSRVQSLAKKAEAL